MNFFNYIYMLKLYFLPFWASMIVIALNGSSRLLKTNVIKTSKASSIYVFYCMIRHKEMLLPPHEDKICQLKSFIIKAVRIKCLCVLIKWTEFALKHKFKNNLTNVFKVHICWRQKKTIHLAYFFILKSVST